MAAVGSITAVSNLHPSPDPQTSNSDTLAHTGEAVINAYTNSVLQVRIDADDNITGDDQTIIIALSKQGGTFTVNTSTEVITTSAAHGLVVGQQIKFTTTGVLPGGLALTGTFTADDTTNVLTTSASHGLKVGQEISFSTSSALPVPLVAGQSYFVQDVIAANQFTVALYPGGPIIDLQTAGVGTQTWVGVITFYVLSTPAANTLTVSTKPGGIVQNITTTGTGTHSWQAYGSAAATYMYPTTGPAVPVTIKQNRDGTPDDFTNLRAIHVALIPTDITKAASGQAYLMTGDPIGSPYEFLTMPLSFTYDPEAPSNPVSVWTGAIPAGLRYEPSWPLTVKIRKAVNNVNLSVLINLLGR